MKKTESASTYAGLGVLLFGMFIRVGNLIFSIDGIAVKGPDELTYVEHLFVCDGAY